MAYAIEAHELAKRFKGGVVALDGVSFAVEPGTVFGLLGPNGAGKTTVVRILTTILGADSGWAQVLGHDVGHDPDLVRRLFGLAGQYAAVDENLTGRENLVMVGRLNHLTRRDAGVRAFELLEEFELVDAADRTLKTYSGGMRRRIDLAAALVTRPGVLFLDEPTTGLDPQSRAGLWAVIESLVGAGTTVLLTTQYLEEADRLASRVAVVDHGRVISQGTPAELKAALGATVLAVGLHDAATAERAERALAPLSDKSPHLSGASVELPVDGGPKVAMEALRVLDQLGIEPVTFVLREPSLDDVFLALTGRSAEQDAAPTSAGLPAPERAGRNGEARR
jgi:daunorubicin resistance ABC transporter ATP-binding subunit